MLDVIDLRVPGILHGITFSIARGEKVALIGESGSGKSMTALSLLGLQKCSGTLLFDGHPYDPAALRGKKISIIFQEPMTALDPLMRVGRQVELVAENPAAVPALFEDLGLDPELASRYPHELSGGQRQRVLIAMALVNNPDLVIADEPTTALDAAIERQILDVLVRAVDKRNAALLLITHDIMLVRNVADRILVMKNGQLDPSAAAELFAAAQPGEPAKATPTDPSQLAVDVQGVTHRFPDGTVALHDVTLQVPQGSRFGIVGGSGSGKTTLLSLLAGLRTPTAGTVRLSSAPQMVFQDPAASFDPTMRIGKALMAPGREAELLTQVGLDPEIARRYPHELSGGQRQRISIARALARDPHIILADEAVSALDVSVRASIIELLREATAGRTLIFVSHDLAVVRELCTDVAVMRRGRIIERGPHIWEDPHDPYTRELVTALK